MRTLVKIPGLNRHARNAVAAALSRTSLPLLAVVLSAATADATSANSAIAIAKTKINRMICIRLTLSSRPSIATSPKFPVANRPGEAENRNLSGVLAQLVERLNGIEEVRGSIPLGSSPSLGKKVRDDEASSPAGEARALRANSEKEPHPLQLRFELALESAFARRLPRRRSRDW